MSNTNYDQLRIQPGEEAVLTVDRWNALVDHLQRLENTLNRIQLSEDGKVGIGGAPSRAIHVRGNGGVSDDVMLESSGPKHCAALVFSKSREDNMPAKSGDTVGYIGFRGRKGDAYTGDAAIWASARNDFSGSKPEMALRFRTLVDGKPREVLQLTETGQTICTGNFVAKGKIEAAKGLEVKGQLELKNSSASGKGWIVMHARASNIGAKRLLDDNNIGDQSLIIGGASKNYIYFYWKYGNDYLRVTLKGSKF